MKRPQRVSGRDVGIGDKLYWLGERHEVNYLTTFVDSPWIYCSDGQGWEVKLGKEISYWVDR